MSLVTYIVSAAAVFIFSGVMAMAGLGAAFLFVPLFYYLGVPLAEATPTALLLNVVSLVFATVTYWRAKLIDLRVGLPVLVTAVALSPFGARLTPHVNQRLLLGLFAGFLTFAGFMMLFHHPRARPSLGRRVEVIAGLGIGGAAGFLGGLLGVGGGNFVLPVLTGLGLETKIAAGTTALVVVFASLSGFLGHVTLGGLDPVFIGVTAAMAGAGSLIGARAMKGRISGTQLKRLIGALLWLIAIKMAWDAVS
jgi:hypothetical protein